MPSTCTYHYYFSSPTCDLTQWPWFWLCYHKITWTKHHMSTKMVHLLRFGNISDKFEVTTIPSKSNITSILKWYIWWILQISYKSFKDSEFGWPLTYVSRSDRLQLGCLALQYLKQTPHQCQNGSFGASWLYLMGLNDSDLGWPLKMQLQSHFQITQCSWGVFSVNIIFMVFTPQPPRLEGYCHCLGGLAGEKCPELVNAISLYKLTVSGCNFMVVFSKSKSWTTSMLTFVWQFWTFKLAQGQAVLWIW